MSQLTYKTQGHQVDGISSEVRFEDLGTFGTSTIQNTKWGVTRLVRLVTFRHHTTGIVGAGRNRNAAFHTCMAAVSRARFNEWRQSRQDDMNTVGARA